MVDAQPLKIAFVDAAEFDARSGDGRIHVASDDAQYRFLSPCSQW